MKHERVDKVGKISCLVSLFPKGMKSKQAVKILKSQKSNSTYSSSANKAPSLLFSILLRSTQLDGDKDKNFYYVK